MYSKDELLDICYQEGAEHLLHADDGFDDLYLVPVPMGWLVIEGSTPERYAEIDAATASIVRSAASQAHDALEDDDPHDSSIDAELEPIRGLPWVLLVSVNRWNER